MKVLNHKSESVVTHHWEVEDGPIVRVNYFTHNGKMMKAERIHCRWENGSGPNIINVSGPLLRKDGARSHVFGKTQYYLRDQTYHGRAEPAPRWLLELLWNHRVITTLPDNPRAAEANDEERA